MSLKSKSLKFHIPLLITVLLLLGYGLVALYSASTVESYQKFGNTTHYIYHQMLYGGLLGIVAMVVLSKIDYHVWQKHLPVLLVITLILLTLVKISDLGFASGGAERWLHLGFITFQPSELAKLVIIFYIASWVDKKRHALNDFYFGVLPTLVIVALFAGLILIQPDMGTMMVVVGIALGLLFAAGVDMKIFLSILAAGLILLFLFIKFEPYRAERLTSFLNPRHDTLKSSYQINQALLAVGSGQTWGYGYGLSRQKHSYLPEVMNDSIFAVTAEELGFARVMIIIGLFGVLALQGFSIAKNASDTFGKLTCAGITIWITLQAVINIAAMVNLLPLTGIPLPFFSYGSSALLVNLAAMGIVFNIAKRSA